MNMAFSAEGVNVYGLETLANWANKKYSADLESGKLQKSSPRSIHDNLLELSKAHNNGKVAEMINAKVTETSTPQLLDWANERFEANLSESDISEPDIAKENITKAAREFFRRELADLEKYVLLQIYDSTWKDHLYSMDHLKESIFLRAFAEKDPKIEYKHEGYRMFNEMLETIDDRVTGTIFKVHLAPGAETRNVWNVSKTQHDEVSQFELAERQRAAAAAPQGERSVKQIKLEEPKVGRNDPCPCGSGKKYKKCCGRN